jgi:hypothetical protein
MKKKEEISLEELYRSIRDSSFQRESDRICRFCGTELKSYKSYFCDSACSHAFKSKLDKAKKSLFKKPKLSRSWDFDPKKYNWAMPYTCPLCGMSFPEERMVEECKELDMNVRLIDRIMGRKKDDDDDA